MTDLPPTEMPELPAGYFFKVTPFNYDRSVYTLKVELHKVLATVAAPKWWRTARVVSSLLAEAVAEHTPSSVAFAARECIKQSASIIARQQTIADRDKFLGTYPPKTLGEIQ